jgi:hypothetical protein
VVVIDRRPALAALSVSLLSALSACSQPPAAEDVVAVDAQRSDLGGDDVLDAAEDSAREDRVPLDARVDDSSVDAPSFDAAFDTGGDADASVMDAQPDALPDAQPDALADARPDALPDAPPIDAGPSVAQFQRFVTLTGHSLVVERVRVLSSGLTAIVGTATDSETGSRYGALIALDRSGATRWARRYGRGSTNVYLEDLHELRDGTVVAAGYTGNNAIFDALPYVVRVEPAGGAVVNAFTVALGAGVHRAHAVELSPSGQLVLAGDTEIANATRRQDGLVLYVNADGAAPRGYAINGNGLKWDTFSDVQVLDDGDFVVLGSSSGWTTDATHHGFVGRFGEDGAPRWAQSIGSYNARGLQLHRSGRGTLLATILNDSSPGGAPLMTAHEITEAGAISASGYWFATFDTGRAVIPLRGGDYMMVGGNSTLWLHTLAPSTLARRATRYLQARGTTEGRSAWPTDDGGFVAVAHGAHVARTLYVLRGTATLATASCNNSFGSERYDQVARTTTARTVGVHSVSTTTTAVAESSASIVASNELLCETR